MPNQNNKAEFLISRGWSQWYHGDYWVHPKTVADPKVQDYTNYGMSAEDAVQYEKIGCPVHKSLGLPVLSRMELAIRTDGLMEEPNAESKWV